AIEYSNGRWVNIPAPRSATLFARQIEIWNHTVDAASSGTALGASLFSWMSGSGSTASEPPPPRISEPPPPRISEPPPSRLVSTQAGTSATGPGMTKARQEKLVALLVIGGKEVVLDAAAMELLGIKSGGRPLQVMQISAVDGKTRADFNRVQNKKDEYVFAY